MKKNYRKTELAGLGCAKAAINVYIANRPNYADLTSLNHVRHVDGNEIAQIGQACGNGWRKVFNVYAKFLYALKYKECHPFSTWQAYRDGLLLQQTSGASLLFSLPLLDKQADCVHIVMGRTYAKSLLQQTGCESLSLQWLNADFAIDEANRFIVCPYFDYRQLSNQKIIQLVELTAPMLDDSLLFDQREN